MYPLVILFRLEAYFFRSLASKGFPSGYSKSVCVRLHSESSEPTILFSQTTPDEHPPTPPPCRWPALLTVPILAKFQLVWRSLCNLVLLASSCLVEHTLTAVCVLPAYQPGRKYNVHSYILLPFKYVYIFDRTCIVLKSGWSSTLRMPLLGVSPPSFSPCLLYTSDAADE